jgi:hypothetical protein
MKDITLSKPRYTKICIRAKNQSGMLILINQYSMKIQGS